MLDQKLFSARDNKNQHLIAGCWHECIVAIEGMSDLEKARNIFEKIVFAGGEK